MKYFRLFFVFLVLAVAHTETVSAEGGLTLEPVFQNISFSADVAQTDFFVTLTNTTGAPLTLRPSVVDFGSLDESGGVAFLGAADSLERKYGLASWMYPEKDVIFLDPGEKEQLRVFIENRESLSPGGHYGAVLFQIGTDNLGGDENVVSVSQSISMLVFAQKKGGEQYDIELKGTERSKNPFFAPTQVRLRFQNGGNVHVVPRGRVTLTDPLGRMVKKGSINPESGLILPETQRTYVTEMQALARMLFPGFYTVTIAHRYDGKDDFSSEEVKIFLFPWQSIALFLVGGGIFGMRHWWRKKKLLRKDKKENDID